MEKITRFKDIPQFTRRASYAVDFPPDYLIKEIDEYVNERGLQLIPEFQRGHVWTEEQQIAYIEFFLRGGITGRDIYLNNPSWHTSVTDGAYNDFVCVDGLQRITAWRRFINNEIPAFGSFYNEFTDRLDITRTMRLHINDLKTEREVVQWYLEMNAGGTPHSEEELTRVRNILSRLESPADDSERISAYDIAHMKAYNEACVNFRKRKRLLENAKPAPFEFSEFVISKFVCGQATSGGISGVSSNRFSTTLKEGDILYVPEEWRLIDASWGTSGEHVKIEYKAGGNMDFPEILCPVDKEFWKDKGGFVSALLMPKNAARIIVKITEVRKFDGVNGEVFEVNYEIIAPTNSASVF